MTTKDVFAINFSGLTHDHSLLAEELARPDGDQQAPARSTIAILRRHPMYDSLVLVKKYRTCLGGHSLEFPADAAGPCETECQQPAAKPAGAGQKQQCCRRRLVSRFLDGDDPVYQSFCASSAEPGRGDSRDRAAGRPFAAQTDDLGRPAELVHVPINGLLDRLKSYTQSGVAVDSRVYAFAMGLKTAERILTTNSMKELQETPI